MGAGHEHYSVVLRNPADGWEEQAEPRVLVNIMTYLIVKWAVGSFLHCTLLLLISNLNDDHWVNVLAHQLAGLDDGDGNLWHKAAGTPH